MATRKTQAGVLVAFRVSPEVAHRLDLLAAHAGHRRTTFLRLLIAYGDATLTLSELHALEASGPLPPAAKRVQELASRNLVELVAEMQPKPLATYA